MSRRAAAAIIGFDGLAVVLPGSGASAQQSPHSLGSNCGPYVTNTFTAGGQSFGWGSKACVTVGEGQGIANFASSQPADYTSCQMYVEYRDVTNGRTFNASNSCTSAARGRSTFEGYSQDVNCKYAFPNDQFAAAETITATISVAGEVYTLRGSREISHTVGC